MPRYCTIANGQSEKNNYIGSIHTKWSMTIIIYNTMLVAEISFNSLVNLTRT